MDRIANDFNESLSMGQKIEEIFLAVYVKKTHPNARTMASEGKFSAYDIICDDIGCMGTHQYKKPLTWEVKSDQKSYYTNNFAFEFENYGKPSGLATTESDFYAIFDKHSFYIIPTSELRAFLGELKRSRRQDYRVVYGGDYNKSKMVLIRKEQLQNPYLQIVPYLDT